MTSHHQLYFIPCAHRCALKTFRRWLFLRIFLPYKHNFTFWTSPLASMFYCSVTIFKRYKITICCPILIIKSLHDATSHAALYDYVHFLHIFLSYEIKKISRCLTRLLSETAIRMGFLSVWAGNDDTKLISTSPSNLRRDSTEFDWC